MFHQDYLKLKQLKEKLTTKFDNHLKKINQDIHIRDIFVYPQTYTKFKDGKNRTYFTPNSGYTGENKKTNKYNKKYSTKERVIDYLNSVAKIANEYHQEYYCNKNADGSYSTKSDCLNKITRISSYEFSFYTKEPLSLQELSEYLKEIHAIAKNQQENVHLLLSSFAVITDDRNILNLSVYVQCGKEPKLVSFCKANPSSVDLTYFNTSYFSTGNAEYTVNDKDAKSAIAISTNTNFTIETLGGASYLQAIDICLDHSEKHAKELLETALKRDVGNHEIIPHQTDHLVTSNSVELYSEAKITNMTVQIDTINKSLYPQMRDDAFDVSKVINNKKRSLFSLKKDKYPKIVMQKTESGGYLLTKPQFGFDAKICVCEERKLDTFTTELKKTIDVKNTITKDKIIESNLNDHLRRVTYLPISKSPNPLINEMSELYNNLLKQCDSPDVNSYKDIIKTEARTLILKSSKKITALIKDSSPLNESSLNKELVKLKTNLKRLPTKSKDAFLKDLTSAIDETITKNKSIRLKVA